MQKQSNPFVMIAVLAFAGWLMFGDASGCNFNIGGDPAPFKADKLCVLIVEETVDRNSYTLGQREAMTSVDGPGSVRAYVATKAGQFRVLDKDADLSKSEPWVQEAMKVPHPSLPWLVAATPSSGVNRELPKTAEETIAALKKIGGE